MKKSKTFDRVLIAILIVLALITLYPFYNVLIISFSNTESVIVTNPLLK